MAAHNQLGKEGEDAACLFLQKEGYTLLERNWRFGRHEIDIIADNDEFIVFVEVKTRSSSQWGNPEDFVSKTQIKRIVDAADFYLREKDISKDARFDIISIIPKNGKFEIEHIDDAFMPPLN